MIKTLLQRPISVLIFFLACAIMGLIAYNALPVSLLPDIAIPQITIKITREGTSARELENTVVKPIRQYLLQVRALRDIGSQTRDGAAIIRLKFDHGINTDLAFIEVNEKIDAAMNSLPRDLARPRVIKASATDLPVFYINLTLKADQPFSAVDEGRFLELSALADNVVKRHIEQLPEVALADMTGLMHKHIQIIPRMDVLQSADISTADIESVLSANNIEPGSMTVREGNYLYNVKFASLLRTVDDIRNIFIEKGGRILKLGDLADVQIVRQDESGLSLVNGKRAITIGVIKQAEETIESLRKSLNVTLADLKQNHPEIEFTINRNQTELLDYTISNLKGDLILGFILVSIVGLVFLGNFKSPLIIGLSTITAFLSTYIVFFLFGQSLNIITISGLILALGNMIDSSIVVTDIITQYRNEGYSLDLACEKGTKEVIVPIFSSTMTTISVFIPLVFMSGIAGAIFYSEAFAVTAGMLISYFTGIILLPTLYKLTYRYELKDNYFSVKLAEITKKIDHVVFPFYDRGIEVVFRYKKFFISILILSIPLCALLFKVIPKSMMPELDYTETVVKIDWNVNIHIEENTRRVYDLLRYTDHLSKENACYIGQREFLLEKDNVLSPNETEIYFRTNTSAGLPRLKKGVYEWIKHNYPKAIVTFAPPDNIFQRIFDTQGTEIVVELSPKGKEEIPTLTAIRNTENTLMDITGKRSEPIPFERQYEIVPDKEKLLLYGVLQQEVYQVLKAALRDNQVAVLRSFQQYLPISISGGQQSIEKVLNETLIKVRYPGSTQTSDIPLRLLLKVSLSEGVKTITSGKVGEHIPMNYDRTGDPEAFIKKVSLAMKDNELWQTSFSGDFFSNKNMIQELTIILFVSILLMYVILVAQFESFLQPVILLMEVPIDIAFALIVLWATGNSLNLMSAIGIIVVVGVIINDSILKIDLINELRAGNTTLSLKEIIHIAGVRRLRAIIMTSLTSVIAMVPILFAFDMGSELQKPLAIAMITTMTIGTLVSIFLIPLLYWIIYERKTNREVPHV